MTETIDRVSWTIDDLEFLPHSEGTIYEIIGGELLVRCTPHRRHQQICGRIFSELNNWSESTGNGETIIAPGIIFSDADNVILD